MVVSGRLRSAKVSRVQGVVVAAGVGASCARRDHGDGENKEKEAATHKKPPFFGQWASLWRHVGFDKFSCTALKIFKSGHATSDYFKKIFLSPRSPTHVIFLLLLS